MNPTSERELKLDVNPLGALKLIDGLPVMLDKQGWPVRQRLTQINYDRYFDKLLPTGVFMLQSNDSYIRVRKTVWPHTNREAEFVAYRKLNDAAYGRPAEIYDYEISVLKTMEIIQELVRDIPDKINPPSPEAIGAVENLESMGLSEIIRLKCERTVFPVAFSDQPNDIVKVKIDMFSFKSKKDRLFGQVEVDYYNPTLFDTASQIFKSIQNAPDLDAKFTSRSKLAIGMELI
jgi:hypothetical protein